jgi:hypothetical protein
LRLVGVSYFTGRVLVGVQYHPHAPVFALYEPGATITTDKVLHT